VKGRSAAITAAIVIVALLGGALWYANRPGSTTPKAGDCISVPGKGSFKKVGCGSHDAAFKVAAVLGSGDSNGCDAYPDVVLSLVDKDRTKTLCLTSAK
jgi:hypothetical protein